MSNDKQHIISVKKYFQILMVLIGLTLLSIAITQIDLGSFGLAAAILFATVKTGLIVYFFMHLKFEKKIYSVFAGIVMLTYFIVIIITFLDYMFL